MASARYTLILKVGYSCHLTSTGNPYSDIFTLTLASQWPFCTDSLQARLSVIKFPVNQYHPYIRLIVKDLTKCYHTGHCVNMVENKYLGTIFHYINANFGFI